MSSNNTVDCGFVYKAAERLAEPPVERDCGLAPPVTVTPEPDEEPAPDEVPPRPVKAARK
jgi:hypothetical protein